MEWKKKANDLLDLGFLNNKVARWDAILFFLPYVIGVLLISTENNIFVVIGIGVFVFAIIGHIVGDYIWKAIFWIKLYNILFKKKQKNRKH